MAVYLISTQNRGLASLWAQELGVNRTDNDDTFVWVPWEPELERKRAMAGQNVSDPKYLIGNFSDYERRKLLRRT